MKLGPSSTQLCRARIGAFTLIELLVVIAVIGILTAIILPAVSRAKESARLTQCLSNVRSIVQAIRLYANHYDDRKPALAPVTPERVEIVSSYIRLNGRPMGLGTLVARDYLDGLGVLRCPSSVVARNAEDQREAWKAAEGTVRCSYVYQWFHADDPTRIVPDVDVKRYVAGMTVAYCQDRGWHAVVMDLNSEAAPEGVPQLAHPRIARMNIGFLDGHAGSFPADESLTIGPEETTPDVLRVWTNGHKLN